MRKVWHMEKLKFGGPMVPPSAKYSLNCTVSVQLFSLA